MWQVLRDAGVTIAPSQLYGGFPTLFAVYYERHRGDLGEPTMVAVLDQLLRTKGFHLSTETLRAAMQAMFAVTQENWWPEPDAIATLEAVKRHGFHIGLISNASDDDNTQALIDKGGFRPYLEDIISSAMFGKRKPHPAIFRAALEHFAVRPSEAVMVGDDYQADIMGAKGVGMQSIWITRRAHEGLPVERTSDPSAVVSALADIPALLPRQG